ncbi:hypothetical protein ACHAXR_011492 [Thalassiosira sp. AJA248-18]
MSKGAGYGLINYGHCYHQSLSICTEEVEEVGADEDVDEEASGCWYYPSPQKEPDTYVLEYAISPVKRSAATDRHEEFESISETSPEMHRLREDWLRLLQEEREMQRRVVEQQMERRLALEEQVREQRCLQYEREREHRRLQQESERKLTIEREQRQILEEQLERERKERLELEVNAASSISSVETSSLELLMEERALRRVQEEREREIRTAEEQLHEEREREQRCLQYEREREHRRLQQESERKLTIEREQRQILEEQLTNERDQRQILEEQLERERKERLALEVNAASSISSVETSSLELLMEERALRRVQEERERGLRTADEQMHEERETEQRFLQDEREREHRRLQQESERKLSIEREQRQILEEQLTNERDQRQILEEQLERERKERFAREEEQASEHQHHLFKLQEKHENERSSRDEQQAIELQHHRMAFEEQLERAQMQQLALEEERLQRFALEEQHARGHEELQRESQQRLELEANSASNIGSPSSSLIASAILASRLGYEYKPSTGSSEVKHQQSISRHELNWSLGPNVSSSDFTIVVKRARPGPYAPDFDTTDVSSIDFVLESGGSPKSDVYHVHKDRVATGSRRSELLARRIPEAGDEPDGHSSEDNIHVTVMLESAADAMGMLLDFCYYPDRELDMNVGNAVPLVYLAKRYKIRALLEQAEAYVMENINSSTAATTFLLDSYLYQLDDILVRAIDVVSHLAETADFTPIYWLPPELLCRVILSHCGEHHSDETGVEELLSQIEQLQMKTAQLEAELKNKTKGMEEYKQELKQFYRVPGIHTFGVVSQDNERHANIIDKTSCTYSANPDHQINHRRGKKRPTQMPSKGSELKNLGKENGYIYDDGKGNFLPVYYYRKRFQCGVEL